MNRMKCKHSKGSVRETVGAYLQEAKGQPLVAKPPESAIDTSFIKAQRGSNSLYL